MKTLVIGAAFATLLASSAFAQSYDAEYGASSAVNRQAIERSGDVRQHRGLRAQASVDNGTAVYVSGQYVGQDPDANVRLSLRRDWMHE